MCECIAIRQSGRCSAHISTTCNAQRERCDVQRQHAACIQQDTSNRQHGSCIVHRAARSRERRAAGCVEHETRSNARASERCSLQRQDPCNMRAMPFHAGNARPCFCCMLRVARCVQDTRNMQHAPSACNTHRAACNIRLRRARDIQHAALKKKT